jgi:hypothetical protein
VLRASRDVVRAQSTHHVEEDLGKHGSGARSVGKDDTHHTHDALEKKGQHHHSRKKESMGLVPATHASHAPVTCLRFAASQGGVEEY